MWLFLGRITGYLIYSGISVSFSRLPTLKVPLESRKGSSLKSVLDFLMAWFLLGAESWVAEVRTSISSPKWIACTALIKIISASCIVALWWTGTARWPLLYLLLGKYLLFQSSSMTVSQDRQVSLTSFFPWASVCRENKMQQPSLPGGNLKSTPNG